jgi:hypothetical protein
LGGVNEVVLIAVKKMTFIGIANTVIRTANKVVLKEVNNVKLSVKESSYF